MLEIRLLGQFKVTAGNQPVEISSRPAQSLLAYLAITAGIAHRREKLAGMLWPDIPEMDARRNLRRALWQIRKAAGDLTPIHADELSITFAESESVWVDALALSHNDANGSAIDQLEASLSAYGGELLPGFYDEWVIIERESLLTHFENRLKQIIKLLIEAQKWEKVLEWGKRWIALAGPAEPAYRALMTAYAESGDMAGVGLTYQRCIETLQKELGIEPSAETRQLYQQLIQSKTFPVSSSNQSERRSALKQETTETRHSIPEPAVVTGEALPTALSDGFGQSQAPFKGLYFYDEQDTAIFFGREALTARLLERLDLSENGRQDSDSILIIVGASGSGKSSLVRAGLAPAVQRKIESIARDVSGMKQKWDLYIITPTNHPLETLATSITQEFESVSTASTLIDDMQRDERSLRLFLRKKQIRLFLIVDQMEELFTLCRDGTERRAFIDNLLAAAEDGECKLVLTLRADFYAHCSQYENLRTVLAASQVYIGPMSTVELRTVIEEPARSNKLIFEAGLVDLILRDAGNEPGALPLLSHALLETWKRRQGNLLTLAGYAEAGGVHGAIARTAEQVYSRLDTRQQRIARNIFLRLTELGEGVQDTRRRATLAELTLRNQDRTSVEKVITLLVEARLVTASQKNLEVAHEALIREWPTLRYWLSENRDNLRLHRRLSEAALGWEELDCEPGELYRGVRLAQAMEWSAVHPDEVNDLEQEFLAASQALAKQEALEREASHQREIDAARRLTEAEQRRAEEQTRSARRLRGLATGLALVLLFSLALAGFALQQRNRSEALARLASSRELAASAISNISIDPERSILLALQAQEIADTKEAENALHQSVQASRLIRVYQAKNKRVLRLVASTDGKLAATSMGPNTGWVTDVWDKESGELLFETSGGLAAGSWSDSNRLAIVDTGEDEATRITLWDMKTFKPISTTTFSYHSSDALNGDLSPDLHYLAVTMVDGTTRVYNLLTGELLHTLGRPGGSPSQAVGFSPDSKQIVVNTDNVTQLWDLTTGKGLLTLPSVQSGAQTAQFSPKKKTVAIALGDVIKIADLSSGEVLFSLTGRTGFNYGIDYSWDGTLIAAGGADGKVVLWGAYTGQELMVLSGHQAWVDDVAFIPFRQQLATSGDDGTVRLWDISPAGKGETANFDLFDVNTMDRPYTNIAYSPDGKRLAVSGGYQGGDVLDSNSGKAELTLRTDHFSNLAGGIAFSPDGAYLASSNSEAEAYIWDAATGNKLITLSGHTNWIGDLAYNPDGKKIATISYDGTVKLWNPDTGQELLTVQAFTGMANPTQTLGIDFSPDGSRFATAGGFSAIIWDTQTGKELLSLPDQDDRVDCVAFSPDGKHLATGIIGGPASVWDAETGEHVADLTGHEGSVNAILFSRDSQQVMTGSVDGTIKIWNASNGEELLLLTRQPTQITGLALSPDGSRLAASSLDGTVHVYLLNVNDLITLAHQRLTRWFTPQECRLFLHMDTCPPKPGKS